MNIYIPIIAAFIAGLFGAPLAEVLKSFLSRKKFHLTLLSDAERIFGNDKNDFYTNFVRPDAEELYFHIRTGIKAKIEDIYKYISFKNSINRKYSWNHIKLINQYSFLSKNEIIIDFKKKKEIVSVTFLILSFLFVVLALTSFLNTFPTNINNFYIIVSSIFLASLSAGAMVGMRLRPILIILDIEKSNKRQLLTTNIVHLADGANNEGSSNK